LAEGLGEDEGSPWGLKGRRGMHWEPLP